MKRLIYAAAAVLLATACGSDSPTAPPPVVVPLCQSANTATIAFGNRSTTNSTFDLVIDGVRRGAIGPGDTSAPFTLAAGVSHTIVAVFTNTTTTACSSTPVPVQCTTQTLTCSR